MRKAVVVAFALLACKSRAEVRPDPARVDAAPDTAIESRARIVRGGEIIDIGAGRLSHALREAPLVAEVNDERRAYLFGKDFVLRAFELSDGKEAWSRKIPTTLRPLVMDDAFVYVIGDSVVTAANKRTGASFGIKAADDRYVLFGRHPSSALRRSLVVRLSDGSVVARVEDDVAAIAKREDGSIAGLLVIDPELRLLETTGAVRWRAPRAAGHHESASAVARGDALFVATYPEFSSGSDLAAYDLATGKPLWKGAVDLLPIGHSEYFNQVTISIVSDRLLLRGDESGVITTQLFELATGNRMLAVSHHR